MTRDGKLIGDGAKASQWKANYHTSRALMNVAPDARKRSNSPVNDKSRLGKTLNATVTHLKDHLYTLQCVKRFFGEVIDAIEEFGYWG